MEKYVIFDFNGTLLDDVKLGLELINEFLLHQNKEVLDIDTYKDIFFFFFKDYYIKAGLDLERDKFEDLALIYNDKYMKRSLSCTLFNDVLEVLKELKDNGYKLVVLSSSEYNNLVYQLKYYNIYDYFDNVLGTSNYEGNSKTEIGYNFISENSINPSDIICIGDTIHDYEVAMRLGAKSILVSRGHQSEKKLKEKDAIIVSNLKTILERNLI